MVFPSRLIALFWTASVLALAAMAYTGAVGWDAKGYWKAVQSVQHNSDPYAEDIVALQVFINAWRRTRRSRVRLFTCTLR